MTTQESAETLGEAAEHYTHGLFTAVIATGSPARVSIGQYAPDDPRAQVGPHTRWPFLLLRLGVPKCTSTASRRARAWS